MPASQADHWTYTIHEWTNPPYTTLLNALPSSLSVIFDIGANVGGWTKVMRDKFPSATFHCFEPVRKNYEHLTENVPWAHHHHLGIFYGKRTSRVVDRGGGNVGAFFVEHIDAGEPRVYSKESMKLRTLEELDLPDPDLIKMDVEGAEENILEHSKLCKDTPWLLIEWHPNTNPHEFFKKHLPKHDIVLDVHTNHFLLCRRSA